MSKAFDEAMSEPMRFWDGEYVISANLYPDIEDAVQVFSKDFGYLVSPSNIHKTWCHWHAGQDDEGQPRNAWWMHPDYEGRRGAQPAWFTYMDRHKRRHGHSYERTDPNSLGYGGPCKVCGENA